MATVVVLFFPKQVIGLLLNFISFEDLQIRPEGME